jgi:hypothetical protein
MTGATLESYLVEILDAIRSLHATVFFASLSITLVLLSIYLRLKRK